MTLSCMNVLRADEYLKARTNMLKKWATKEPVNSCSSFDSNPENDESSSVLSNSEEQNTASIREAHNSCSSDDSNPKNYESSTVLSNSEEQNTASIELLISQALKVLRYVYERKNLIFRCISLACLMGGMAALGITGQLWTVLPIMIGFVGLMLCNLAESDSKCHSASNIKASV